MVLALLLLCSQASAVQPNFLMLFLDQWRWDWAGFDAPDLRVPTIKSLALGGTRFTQAYTPSPVCEGARFCLASVREYDETHMADFSDYNMSMPTWYSVLQNQSYHTMFTGKDDLTKHSGIGLDGRYHMSELGLSDQIGRSSGKQGIFKKPQPGEPYASLLQAHNATSLDGTSTTAYTAGRECYGYFRHPGQCCVDLSSAHGQGAENCMTPDTAGDELYLDNYVGQSAELLLERAPLEKPWALHVSFPGPHPPFIITKAMNESVAGRTYPSATDNPPWDDEMNIRRQYAAEVENLDALMARIIKKVELSGQLNRTLIVVTGDHGEELGDHGNFGKSKPWEGAVHVPLIVKGPGVAAGRTVTLPVTTLDVIGTFLDRADAPLAPGMSGRSLWPLLSDTSNPHEANYRGHVNIGLANFRAVVKRFNHTSTLKLICCDGDCPGRNPSVVTPRQPTEEMSLMLFNMTAHSMDMVLVDISQNGEKEAREMIKVLPSPYDTKCAATLVSRISPASPIILSFI